MTNAFQAMPLLKAHACMAAALVLLGGSAGAQNNPPATIESVADVLKLPPLDAMGRVPRSVRLRGVVLALNASRSTMHIHDGTAGIGVMLKPETGAPVPGDRVLIEGRAVLYRVSSFTHTRVQAGKITIEGKSLFPEPVKLDITTLNTFSNYDQWVSLEGYVMEWRHAGSMLSLKLVDDKGMSTAHISMAGAEDIPKNLLGARVRLTGVNTGDHTALNALTVPGPGHLEVLAPGHQGVFDAPLASIHDITRRKVEAGKRWRVRGVAAAVSGRSHLYLQGSGGALTCELHHRATDPRPGVIYGDAGPLPEIAPGDQVEVEGSAIGTDAGLMWSHVRVMGKGDAPKPEEVDIRTLGHFADTDRWVSLEGVVHAWTARQTQAVIALSDATGSLAILMRECPPEALPKNLFGARVRLTGMSQVLARASGGPQVHVPGPSFLEVIQPGSPDPYAAPEVPLQDIKNPGAPASGRVRTRGVITGIHELTLYVRGGKAAACVRLQPPWPRPQGDAEGMIFADAGPLPSLEPGDEVEVVGMPMRRAGHDHPPYSDLDHAYVRVTGRQEPPEPVDATLPDIAHGLHDAEFVHARGRLARLQPTPLAKGEWQFELVLEAGGVELPVNCHDRSADAFSTLKVNDEVSVHGLVNRVDGSAQRGLWLPKAENAKSLGLSPSVRIRRLLVIGGAAALALGTLAAWILLLLRNQRIQRASACELKAAAEAARASEQRWQLLFEQSPLSVQIFAPDGQTKRFNNAWRSLFRLSDEQGLAFNVLQAPDLVSSGAVRHIRKAFEGEVVHVPPVPFTIRADPPEIRWIGGLLYPLKNEAGQILEVVVIHHDITETRRAEEAMLALNQTLEQKVAERTEELRQAQADLARALEHERELGELKSRFVSMVSHEFRTPLGVTMSAVEILRHYGQKITEDHRSELLDDIHSATGSMAGIMEQVLLLGRVEAAKLGCKRAPVDFAALAEKLADEALSSTSRKCQILWQDGGGMGGALGDETLLRHIFSNLISNAVKYSPEGSDVVFSARREGCDLVAGVADSGIGIPEKDREHLYEAFHRCGNVGEIPGTGLGLVIVKRCVEIHGGSISFVSQPGRSTTFTVRIPMFEDPANEG